MKNRKPEHTPIRQVLVVVDSVSDNLAIMESAVEIAARLEAELAGLFIEDIDLLRAAGLPVSREIMLRTARERNPTEIDMIRSLRALAGRVQENLAHAAQRARVQWSFRTVRGPRLQSLLEAGADSDLMLIGPARRLRIREYSRQDGPQKLSAISLLYTASPAADRALAAVLALAEQSGGPLNVLSVGNDSKDQGELHAFLKEPLISARLLELSSDDSAQVMNAILADLETRTLVIPVDAELVQDTILFEQLLGAVNCSIVLVR